MRKHARRLTKCYVGMAEISAKKEGAMQPRSDIIESDGSVRPREDTGFRARPTEPSIPYTQRQNPLVKKMIGTLHVDDIKSVTETQLRGVNYITVDYKKVERRFIDDIRRNIRVPYDKIVCGDGKELKKSLNSFGELLVKLDYHKPSNTHIAYCMAIGRQGVKGYGHTADTAFERYIQDLTSTITKAAQSEIQYWAEKCEREANSAKRDECRG